MQAALVGCPRCCMFESATAARAPHHPRSHIQHQIAAAHDIGLAGCITAVTLSRSGALVDQEMRCKASPPLLPVSA